MREPVSSVDLAVLRLEEPTNLMVITGVLTLGRPVELQRLRATLEARLLRHDRFRQRVVNTQLDGGPPYWEEDTRLDLGYHVQQIALPAPGDEAALQDLVSRIVSLPLDPDRPLWQFLLVEPYGPGCAVILRIHHCVGDGQALVQVLLSLTDATADAPSLVPPAVSPAAPPWDRPEALRPLRARLRRGRRLGRRLVRRGLRLAAHPSRVLDLAETGGQTARVIRRLALTVVDGKPALRGELGVRKRVAWSATIPLDGVKLVGRRLGGTVNDVLLAAASGAMRRYLLARGEAVDDLDLHAAIPVSLRSPGAEAELGNRVGVILLPLPVSVADPVERLRVIRRRMDRRKNSPEAPLLGAALSALGSLPAAAEGPVVGYFSSRLTAVITNVAGPCERLYLAGAPVDALMAWVPKTGGMGLGVSFLSYAGDVRVGIISDAGLVPDPEAIVAAFQTEFDALLALAQGVSQTPPVRASLSMLDDALAALEALLDGRSEAPGLTADEVDPIQDPPR
jgi:diacylglycerol O-acyltransferase